MWATPRCSCSGQTVNSYRDPSSRGLRFADLLAAVAETPGIRRVRFTTSHPSDLDAATIAAMDSLPQLCEHLHLPVQSGSTRVLRAMQRTYTRDEYLAKIAMVTRRAPPHQHHHGHHRRLPGRDGRRLRGDAQPAG